MTEETLLTKQSLARQIAEISTLEGEFTLRSGQVSNRYFDKYRFEGVPTLLKPLAREMAKLLPSDTEILAGLDLGEFLWQQRFLWKPVCLLRSFEKRRKPTVRAAH